MLQANLNIPYSWHHSKICWSAVPKSNKKAKVKFRLVVGVVPAVRLNAKMFQHQRRGPINQKL